MTLPTQTIEQQLLHVVRALPRARATEVLDFAEFLFSREQPQTRDVHAALQDSFGVWRDRTDLTDDSAVLVRAMRDEWRVREDRLGLG